MSPPRDSQEQPRSARVDDSLSLTQCEVVVVGGGPAGSTTAALLAESGHDVVLCERERFPRFHVGESLLPWGSTVLERLGVLDRCRAIGWTRKPGASFLFERAVGALGDVDSPEASAAERDAWCSIRFDEALATSPPETFQVPRAEFDAMLLDRAAELGVRVLEQTALREAVFSADAVHCVAQGVDEGTVSERGIEARFLVDASGQSGFLSKRLGIRAADPELRNLAAFAHFTGWRWPCEIPPGNIQVISLRSLGWLWIIPLSSERVSVGLVEPASAAARGRDRDARLAQILAETPVVAPQARSARRCGPVHGMVDFGYAATSYHGDRWVAVGDAGSFVDPVFSTGVFLALRSGEEAAAAIHEALTNPGRRRRAFAAYQRDQARRYRFFRRFVSEFYRPGMRDLLCQRREMLGLPGALSAVLAGEWQPRFGVRWRLEAFYALARLQARRPLVPRLHLADNRA